MYLSKITLSIFSFSIFFLAIACGEKQAASNEKEPSQTETVAAAPKPKKKLSEGERLFLLCQACHSLKKGEAHKTGPNLHNLFGKKAGTAEGYANYSEAIKNSGIVWDESQLREWLAKPTDFLPGTSMAFIGIKEEAKQTKLIEYLKEQTK